METATLCHDCLELMVDGKCVDNDCFANHHRALLVTGDRAYDKYGDAGRVTVEQAFIDFKPTVVVHGLAKGADTIARDLAKAWRIREVGFAADWGRYGRGAGPMRNTEMLSAMEEFKRQGYEVQCAAFHESFDTSKGTFNMVKQCLDSPVFNRVFLYRISPAGPYVVPVIREDTDRVAAHRAKQLQMKNVAKKSRRQALASAERKRRK